MKKDNGKFDRSGNFGCVNYDNTYETCIKCGICERPELVKSDCVYDAEGKYYLPKDKYEELKPRTYGVWW